MKIYMKLRRKSCIWLKLPYNFFFRIQKRKVSLFPYVYFKSVRTKRRPLSQPGQPCLHLLPPLTHVQISFNLFSLHCQSSERRPQIPGPAYIIGRGSKHPTFCTPTSEISSLLSMIQPMSDFLVRFQNVLLLLVYWNQDNDIYRQVICHLSLSLDWFDSIRRVCLCVYFYLFTIFCQAKRI